MVTHIPSESTSSLSNTRRVFTEQGSRRTSSGKPVSTMTEIITTSSELFSVSTTQNIALSSLAISNAKMNISLLVALVVVISVLVLIVIVVGVLIILKRKGKWHKNPLELFRSTKSILREETIETPTQLSAGSEQNQIRVQYEQFDVPNDVIEKPYDEMKINNANGILYNNLNVSHNTEDIFAPGIGEYDTMANIQAAQNQNQGIYDTFERI